MKVMRVGSVGRERPAVRLDDGRVVDVSAHVADVDGSFLDGGGLDRLARIVAEADELPEVDPNVRVGSPVARPGKVVCIGLNFADHAAESGMDLPEEPTVFFKAPNTIVGPHDDVLLPPMSKKGDWEVELAVVIGSTARYLSAPADAPSVIAGYAISNDVSEREFQLERGGQWVKGKSCETFNPLGPWLVTPDELDDVGSLDMSCRVNGEQMQTGTTASMAFDPSHIVWYLSQFMVLEPGDLINTGTPAGVGLGHTPPRFLRPGDVMELGIDGLGVQRQHVRRTTA